MKKIIESIESTYRILSVLKTIGYDISKDEYWTNNPYFHNYESMDSFIRSEIQDKKLFLIERGYRNNIES